MKNCNLKSENGRSMIEMLGVLAIIGVLSVGGIAGYSKAMMKYRINKTIEQITLVSQNVKSFFAPQKNFKGLNGLNTGGLKIIKKAKLVPEDMIFDDHLEDLWGGWITLESAGDGFAYVFIDASMMPEEACIEIISQDWNIAGFKYIHTYNSSNDYIAKVPVSVENAVRMCSPTYLIAFYYNFDLKADWVEGGDPYVYLE